MVADRGRGGLDALFAPRSVAVYGASASGGRLGNTLLSNVMTGGARHVVAVHPSAAEIAGVASVASLREPVDLALVSVPALAVPEAVADAAAAGCGACVVLSSGFGETGPEGRAVEERLTATARAAGMRLVGPNCMGVVSGRLNGSYFWSVPDRRGPVSFVSQSGAFGGMFFAQVRERGLGLARFVSVGNAADVGEADVLEWLADDEETGVVGVFAEAIRDGRRFVAAARAVTAHKPVVVLKAGKQRAGARAAASHTGSLAGTHGAVQAAFDRAGVIEAVDSDSFFDALAALATLPRTGRRVAVLTISGGPGVLAADAAERLGLELPPLSSQTAQRLRGLVPAFAALGNPIDLTPQCPPPSYGPAVAAVFDDPAFDAVVMIDCGLDVAEFGEAVATAARRTGKPVTAFVLDVPEIAKALDLAGIPRFASPERAVAGVRRAAV